MYSRFMIAKLVYNLASMVHGRSNELVKGGYKPKNITFGGPTLYKWNEITILSFYISS